MKLNKPQILMMLLLIVFILEIISGLHKNNIIPTMSLKAVTDVKIKDDLIITLFMNDIEADSSSYYNNFFSDKLEYYDYETKIVNIKRGSDTLRRFIYITFGSTPMIGAHNPVGYDEITYKVDVTGNVTLENFTHLESFDIPEWLRTNMIKPYPE